MVIGTLYEQRKKTTVTRFKDIKDFSLFDFNYIPDEPIIRQETEHLIDEMVRFELSGIPTHQAIIGSKGCGKTVTLKYLQKAVPIVPGEGFWGTVTRRCNSYKQREACVEAGGAQYRISGCQRYYKKIGLHF